MLSGSKQNEFERMDFGVLGTRRYEPAKCHIAYLRPASHISTAIASPPKRCSTNLALSYFIIPHPITGDHDQRKLKTSSACGEKQYTKTTCGHNTHSIFSIIFVPSTFMITYNFIFTPNYHHCSNSQH